MFKFSSRQARVSTAAAAARARRSVASPQQPDWISIRRRDRPQDLELAPHAVRWWHALPSEVRPVHLVQKYPRLVNLLSQCWSDPRLVHATFASLLNDQRGNRQGFPTMIISELRRLREHAPQPLPEAARAATAQPGLRTLDAPAPAAAPRLADAWDLHWEVMTDR
jgi:hypothetical protein